MKKLFTALCLAATLCATGCEMSNNYGECKGFIDQGEKDPNLKYEVSKRNVILAIIFSETLLWPGLTGAFWVWCPTGRK